MRRGFIAALTGGLVLAVVGWLAWSGTPDTSQEAVANLSRARDFFGLTDNGAFPGWWSPNFLGGLSLAPLWGSVLTSAWLVLWAWLFGDSAGPQVAMLACVPMASVTMYVFLRRLTERDGVAALGGLFYAMAPTLWIRMMWVEHAVVVVALALLPLACWGIIRLARRPSALSALLCGAACAAVALAYSKAALLAAPALAVFALWALWKYCGLAAWLTPRVWVPLALSLLLLGVCVNLPALRESESAVLFEFGPLAGWQQSFSAKSALQFFDRLGVLSAGFRGDYAPTTSAGGFYLGAVPLLLAAAVLALRKRFLGSGDVLAGIFRAMCGLALFSFWLAHGPFSTFSGILRALEASAGAADFFPALLWLSLLAQGWAIWALLPVTMPLRKACGIMLLAVYFLVPGFPLVAWIPLYADIRAPFDFFQVAGAVWACAAAAVAAGMLYAACHPPRRRLAAVGILAAILGVDFAGHLALPVKRALPGGLRSDFEAAAAFVGESPKPGGVFVLSGRYFYLRMPELTGRPLLHEAFQSYLQQRGLGALTMAGYGSAGDFTEYLRVAGAAFVVIDKEDPDLSEAFATELVERFPKVFDNRYFSVLAVPSPLAPAYLAKDALLLDPSNAADIAASLAAASADFVGIGPTLPGRSSGAIRDGSIDLAKDIPGHKGRPFAALAPDALRRVSPVRIEVDAPGGEGWLVVPEAWHRDWVLAATNGSGRVYQAFGAFLAAESPKNPETLVFEFRPPAWYGASLAVAGFSWITLIGVVVCPPLRRRLDFVPSAESRKERRAPVSRPLIVSPTYNEADSLPALLDGLSLLDEPVDVLVVDDASPDGTADIVRKHPQFSRRLFLIGRKGKLGLGSAYREGFRWAAERGYDACIEIDADLSHDPADIPRLLAALNEGADAAVGSRYLEGLRVVNWPEHRLLLSAFATQFVRFVTGMPLTDATSGFKALRREALDRLDWSRIKAEGYGFQVELHHALWKSGARMVEVPITFTERRAGHTKMTAGIAFEAMLRVIELALRSADTGRRGLPKETGE